MYLRAMRKQEQSERHKEGSDVPLFLDPPLSSLDRRQVPEEQLWKM